jgi:RNA polymerase sigma-70 factor (ECF subfamily)
MGDDSARMAPTADQQLERDEQIAALQRAIDTLPERRRMVLLLRWRDGLRNDEVAEIMGISVKTVENQITQALRMLREQLFEHRD